MTNNNPLVNALTQINSANRNKQLLLIFGGLTIIGMVGFGVIYFKLQNTKTDAKNYREKLLKANQTIFNLQDIAEQSATLEKNKETPATESKETTIS
jgi:hypothetical protein